MTEHQVVKLTPPDPLLAHCPEPEPPAADATNLDLLNYAISLKLALKTCNQSKAKLRAWYGDTP